MTIHSRSEWTSTPARGNTGNDDTDGMPNFRAAELLGICVHYTGVNTNYQGRAPAPVFENIRKQDMGTKGYGDIMYNLGVAGNIEGPWILRGLTNKGAANGGTASNNGYLSVLCLVGENEKPTDLLLQNLQEARRLTLIKYPHATKVVGHKDVRPTACPGIYLDPIIKNPEFWKGTIIPPQPKPPTKPAYVCKLPPAPLQEGDKNVHVQDLQEALSFWGYYKVRADGNYGPLTRASVKELQADLKDAGKYRKNLDGQFGKYTRDGWCAFLKDLWNMSQS
jgi:hypothetical protein